MKSHKQACTHSPNSTTPYTTSFALVTVTHGLTEPHTQNASFSCMQLLNLADVFSLLLTVSHWQTVTHVLELMAAVCLVQPNGLQLALDAMAYVAGLVCVFYYACVCVFVCVCVCVCVCAWE